ncbi:transmembrane and coiled-coil domain-containing protein 6 isoform 3-T3 [Alca torda]
MWGRPRRGAGPGGGQSAEELRARRREREAALRKARRQEQLVSKRLLREDIAEEGGQDGAESVPGPLSEDEVLQLLRGVQRGSEDRKSSLGRLRWALQSKETQQKFVRLDGSIRTLIGLFTSSLADMQMEAARCLHELSHSSDPAVAEACLPVTSYLLTYLSGHSVEFTELCLYTLGNLVVESEAVRKQLLPQGIIPVLASCIQLVCPVLRCLSNLLAEETGCEGQIQDERLLIALFLILQSFFQQHPFIVQECLWLLNNLTGECPTAMSPELLLGPASIAGRSWLHRPLSETMILSMVPALADDPFFCSALLSLDLLPALLQLLPCSQMAGVLVLTVLCNVAEKGPTYCQQLHHQPALPLLLPTLALPDPEVVGQCLELLHLLFLHCPEVRAGDACPTIKPKVIKAGMGIIITIEMILPSAIATPAPVLSTQTHACLKGDTL